MQGQKRQCRFQRVVVLFAAVFIFLLYFMALDPRPWNGTGVHRKQETVGYQESHWELQSQGEILDRHAVMPSYQELESGRLYTLRTRLTYDGSKDHLPYGFLYVCHMYCRVSCDDQVLFSYMPEDIHKLDHSKSPGFIYKAFRLPRDCQGKELTIDFLPALTVPMDYGLPEIAFGDFLSNINISIQRGLVHNVVTILCFLLGAAAIVFSSAALRGTDYREGISIGIFALLFSLYAVTECTINFFFIGNPYYTYLLNYTAFSLLPVSLMGFIRERMEGTRRRICSWVIGGELLFFLAEMVLHFTGILDMREILPLIHFIYFSQMGLVFLLLLTRKGGSREMTLVLQLLPILVGMILDGIIYWFHLGIGLNDATVTMLGVMFFLISEVVHVWKSSVNIYSEYARSKLYRQMAYTDELTGANNRRAFDEEIQRISQGERQFETITVVSVDINDLKWVNDHLGHHAGDHLIRSAARIMQETMGDRGQLFRTGGDEFVVFLYNITREEYEGMVRQVMDKALVFDEENPFRLVMAVGSVQISDNRVLEAVKAADRMMYADKEERKRRKEAASRAGTSLPEQA